MNPFSLLTHLDPQRLHGPRALFVDGEAVREVDHIVLRAVDHQDGRRNLEGRDSHDENGEFELRKIRIFGEILRNF